MGQHIELADLQGAQPWNFSCPDWFERLQAGQSPMPDLPMLDEKLGDKAVNIFNNLHLPDVPGTPSLGESSGQWLRDIVRAIFGSLIDGKRHVAEVFAMVPKKNAKTTGGAAILLTAFLMNQRPRADFVYVAPTQEIAEIAFQQTVGMIEADPEGYLAKRFHVKEHHKTIIDRVTKAKAKVKTFDMKIVTGAKPVFVLLDELHLMATINHAGRIIGQLRGGFLTNPEACLVMITTQSDVPPEGAFKTELNYARKVREGEIKRSRMLPVLFEFPEDWQTDEDQPWRDPTNWHLVTPNMGYSIDIKRLYEDYETAVDKGDDELIQWASQHLNVQIGMALHADRWAGCDFWIPAAEPDITLDYIMEWSDVCVAGIDGGGLDDLAGLSIVGRHKETRVWMGWARAWAHQRVLERRKDIAEILRGFEKDGDLVICETPTQDHEDIADICEEILLAELFPEKEAIGLDALNVATLCDELNERKMSDDMLRSIPQGFRLSGAVWGLERKLADRTFVHGDQPLMRWIVGNAKQEQRGNAIIIDKAINGKAKIDPLVALFNSTVLMSKNPVAAVSSTSPWDDPEYRMNTA